MERKSMGIFISALRKANGMTQKDLAERLNVSDKSVSRWERDDGYPDLSLIPVIAEIFGVTSDELLKGERKVIAEGNNENKKIEKQMNRIINSNILKFKNYSLITSAISILGLIAAFIWNFTLHNAIVGFYFALPFFLIAVILQIIFKNNALSAIKDEMFENENLSQYRLTVFKKSTTVFFLTAMLFVATVPFLEGFYLSNYGLQFEYYFLQMLTLSLPAFLIFSLILLAVQKRLFKNNYFNFAEQNNIVFLYNLKLKQILLIIAVALYISTITASFAMRGGGDTLRIAEGTTFSNFEDFKNYIEQEVERSLNYYSDDFADAPVATVAPDSDEDGSTYYDEHGNIITKEQANTHQIISPSGQVIGEFVRRNEQVRNWRISFVNDELSSITAYTQEQFNAAINKSETIRVATPFVYLVQVFVIVLIYLFKKKKTT